MKYSIDFSGIGLDEYKNVLLNSYLIPSHRVLLTDIEQNFSRLKTSGIQNLEALQNALKTKQKLAATSTSSGIPEDYLTVLNRELNSRQPPPRSIKDYPGLDTTAAQLLENMGIKTSRQLFDKICLDGEQLQKTNAFSANEIRLLFQISSLCRLRYVSPAFANLLIAADCDSVKKIAAADAASLYEKILVLNGNNSYFKGNIGLNDIRFLIQDAKFFDEKLK